MTYLSAGDLLKAELYCNKLLQLSQVVPDPELWLLEIQGKWEELIITAEKYTALYPEDRSAYGYKANDKAAEIRAQIRELEEGEK